MANEVSEGKRRAHAARRARAAEQQLVAKHMTAEFRAKVELMTRRALYARGNYDEHVRGEQPHAVRQNNRHVDDITQNVLIEFFQHPDWLTKADSYIWRSINFAIGDHFRGRGTKPGVGTVGIPKIRLPVGGLSGRRHVPVSDDEFGAEQYSDEPGYAPDYDNINEPSYGYE